MKKIISFIYLYIISQFTLLLSGDINVTLQDPVYSYLNRLSTQGYLDNYINTTLPIGRNYISETLITLNENRKHLSSIDRKILDNYILEYQYEIKESLYYKIKNNDNSYHPFQSLNKFKNSLFEIFKYSDENQDNHFFVYQTSKDRLLLDFGAMTKYKQQKNKHNILFKYHYSLSIQIGQSLIIHSDADIYSMIYNGSFNNDFNTYPHEFKGGFPLWRSGYYGYENEMSYEYSNAYIKHNSNFGSISFRAEPIKWGNGLSSIILSDNSPAFPNLFWEKKFSNGKISSFHGKIIPKNHKTSSEGLHIYQSKYLVGHRWDIYTKNNTSLAFTEMLVYGGRDPEPIYLFPTIFLWPVQHNMNSIGGDNIIWFFDGSTHLLKGSKVYGTLMLDELQTSKIFSNAIENRWGIQLGINIAKYVHNLPFELTMEFTAIRPWAYTHRIPQLGTYSHNSRNLGFKHGPNSQLFHIENRWWINYRNHIVLSYKQLKKGLEPYEETHDEFDFGNNVNDNYLNANLNKYKNNTSWLIGEIKTTKEISLIWIYNLSNTIDLHVYLDYYIHENTNSNTITTSVNINY
tara:strand:+ start:31 stop:1749 length:1719 start_codon:yes stop_codon:yes gene_type:complete